MDNSTVDQRLIQFHVVFENERHVVSVSYLKKRKLLELHFRKKKEISKGKNLSQAGVFPLRLQDDDLRWKLSLDYNVP